MQPLVAGGRRWGLVPGYTKPTVKPDYFRMFNARSESVLEKPVFSRLMRSCRCIVLLNGFYEWKKVRPLPIWCTGGRRPAVCWTGPFIY